MQRKMRNPIDSRQLSHFCEIVNTNSIRKAAKNLNLTTSAVSHSLKKLEEDLGCKLFTRDTRNLVLNYAGQRLHSNATELLESLNRTRYLVQDWSEVSQKTLRIGATSAACQYIIPTALRELKESFPGMAVQITQGSSYELREAIEDKQVDVAIYPWGNAYRKNHIALSTDNLEFIINPLHPWSKKMQVDYSSLESQRFILTDSRSYTFDLVCHYFQNYNHTLMPFIEISNEESIKRLVELDLGIGILPDWMVRKEIRDGSLISLPIGRKQLKRHWIVSHQQGHGLSFAETLFVGVVSNTSQSIFSELIQ